MAQHAYKFDHVATPAAPDFTTRWESLQIFSDRFGELSEGPDGNSPELQHLIDDEAHWQRLAPQIWGEAGFLGFFEGQYGVLFEGEFPVIESDRDSGMFPGEELRPRAEVNAELLSRIPALEAAFPGVHFAVPHEDAMVDSRAGLWAFVPDGLITEKKVRERLAHAVLDAGVIDAGLPPADAAGR